MDNMDAEEAVLTWVTASEAAEILGVNLSAIYHYVERGVIRNTQRYGRIVLDQAGVEAYKSVLRPNKLRKNKSE